MRENIRTLYRVFKLRLNDIEFTMDTDITSLSENNELIKMEIDLEVMLLYPMLDIHVIEECRTLRDYCKIVI